MITLLALFLVFLATFLGATGSVFMKRAAANFSFNPLVLAKNPSIYFAVSLFLISSALYIPALRLADLLIVYPLSSLSYIWAIIFGKATFKEKITKEKLIGVGLIIAGIILISIF